VVGESGMEAPRAELIARMVKRVFGGSAERFVLGALSARELSSAEIANIRKMLDDFEKQERGAK
jgi:BlaI family transcriptional regulator, penicillinase repressor